MSSVLKDYFSPKGDLLIQVWLFCCYKTMNCYIIPINPRWRLFRNNRAIEVLIIIIVYTRRLPLVEQEQHALPENLSFTPVLSGDLVARSLFLGVIFCSTLLCPFVLFLLAIVLSVLLRFTASDYTFGIFKLFLRILSVCVHFSS
jgi:hypothetical protein